MSKRCLFMLATVSVMTAIFLVFSPHEADSQVRARIVVDSLAYQPFPGDTFSLSVRIENIAPGTSISGFDLKLQFGISDLRLLDVQPGQLLTDCTWEHFAAPTSPPNVCFHDSCPDGEVQLIGIADLAAVSGSHACFIDQPGELAQLTFQVSIDRGCDEYLPVQFLWDDCTDNMLALSTTSETLLISDRVYLLSNDITGNDPLPSSDGAPNQCVISGAVSGNTIRAVDFAGGGVISACQQPLASGARIALVDIGEDNWVGTTATVNVQLEDIAPGYQLGSFDLYIKYDPTKLVFANAEQGELIINCGYADFIVQVGPNAPCGSGQCPEGIVRIIALATGLQTTPTCFIDRPGQIAGLHFQVDADEALGCARIPVELMWFKCGDNEFTEAPSEGSTAFERTVYDVFGFSLPDSGIEFPSIAGNADTCTTNPNPAIDFQQTVVTVPCGDYIDARGDISLNGIPNEVADWVVLSNYMIYGSAAFLINGAQQAAASDVNADGMVLTLDDLVYLSRIIIGDGQPFPTPPNVAIDTATIAQNTSLNTVSLLPGDSITALYLVFEGEATASGFDFPNHFVWQNFDGTHSRVLFIPNIASAASLSVLPKIGPGMLFSYTGNGILIGAEASLDGLSYIPTEISIPGFQQCCHLRGNINHDAGDLIDIADVAYMVQYMFGDGLVPLCLEEANVNGSADGIIDISDLIFLIKYMYVNGATPPSCPTQTKSWRYIAMSSFSPVVEGLFTITVDDQPYFGGEWFLNQLDPNALVGPQIGHGAWSGDDSTGPLLMKMNEIVTPSRVHLTITNRLDQFWEGTWEYRQSGTPVSDGRVFLSPL